MKKILSLLEYDPSKGLEENIFRIIVVLAVFTSAIFTPICFWLGLYIASWIFLGYTPIFLWVYHLAFAKKRFQLAKIILFIVIVSLLSFSYFWVSGMSGRTWLYLVILGMLVPLIFNERKLQIICLSLTCFLQIVLVLVEFWKPEYVLYYSDKGAMFAGSTTTQVIATITIFTLI
ncbi:MAG: hypothetical protein NZ516_10710, partial [Raineya sp.]|nr:hypothetical protein [Raineya sp.]